MNFDELLYARGESAMWDIGMLAMGAVFFTIAMLYVKGCESLAKKEPVK